MSSTKSQTGSPKTRHLDDVINQKTTLGGRLRHARESQGIIQQDMADELGMSKRHYIRHEKDQVVPSRTTVEKIANMTKVGVEWLLHGVGSMSEVASPEISDLVTSVSLTYRAGGKRMDVAPGEKGLYVSSKNRIIVENASGMTILRFDPSE
ncbi:MAG: helix-turn-helix transcriptional regulator [Rhodothermales bacterium]|nr:helix-turn-helix transcriptional regulator [Rhodothermales bacterium]MBO6779770.1 helix-turn-helix transcriptional regulator [Rhodothermales bacterium]